MGLRDKLSSVSETVERLRQQASAIAEQAQQSYESAASRLERMQASRTADALLLELGGLSYLERTGRAGPAERDRMAAITRELEASERAGTPVRVTPATPSAPGATGAVPRGVGEEPSTQGEAAGSAAPVEPDDAQANPLPEGSYGAPGGDQQAD